MNICANSSEKNGQFYCRAASYKKCNGESCSFHISCEDAKTSLEKANSRLNSFSDAAQRHYADTYYSGQMPWKK